MCFAKISLWMIYPKIAITKIFDRLGHSQMWALFALSLRCSVSGRLSTIKKCALTKIGSVAPATAALWRGRRVRRVHLRCLTRELINHLILVGGCANGFFQQEGLTEASAIWRPPLAAQCVGVRSVATENWLYPFSAADCSAANCRMQEPDGC